MNTQSKIEFRVHGISTTTVSTTVDIGGEPVNASVPCLEVQLDTVNPFHGALTLRFVGGDIAVARDLYKMDAIVDLVAVPRAPAANNETSAS